MRSSSAIVIVGTAGVLTGAVLTYAAIELGWLGQATRTAPRVIHAVPSMTVAEAESHREAGFAAITSIEQVMALPGEFSRVEGLYTLAGRSDSAELQELIFQASGIAAHSHRKSSLEILFGRLTELDPRSALALSLTPQFREEQHIQADVWRRWGRQNLDAALQAATTLQSPSQRRVAAQSLLAAFGYQGNSTTQLIERTLGVRSDEATQELYILGLADVDPAQAVDHILSTMPRHEQLTALGRLGKHLGKLDYGIAARYGALVPEGQLRNAYNAAVAAVTPDPEALLDALMSNSNSPRQGLAIQTAMTTLATRDLERALDYFDGISNARHRETLASVLGQQLAMQDPTRALAWAAENDRSANRNVQIGVLAAIAVEDPDLAIEEAQRALNPMQRRHAWQMIAMRLSNDDPRKALPLLDRIEQPNERISVAHMITGNWLQTEPDEALDWILQSDLPDSERLLFNAAQMVAHTDIDKAISMLPRIDGDARSVWQAAIASNLATQRSVGAAEAFIAQYEGSDAYPALFASAVSGIAQADIDAAVQIVGRMPTGSERDWLVTQLISRKAEEDPRQAIGLLRAMTDDDQRAQATASLVAQWSHSDPAAAQQWTEELPRGAARDRAIGSLASTWDELTPRRRGMLDSIDSEEMRKHALMMHVYRVARSDSSKAENLARDLDFPEDELQQLLRNVRMMRHRGASMMLR